MPEAPLLTASSYETVDPASYSLTKDGFYYTIADGEATVYGYEGEETEITIPSEIDGTPVTAIEIYQYRLVEEEVSSGEYQNFSYYTCKWSSITAVTIPGSVKSIGDHAFFVVSDEETGDNIMGGCTALTTVTLLEGVEFVNACAFSSCKNLTSVTLPDSLKSIGSGAFRGCSALSSILLPKNLTHINDGLFSGCKALSVISIPDSVTDIGRGPFYNCSALTEITIPDGVTSIGSYAFCDCSALTEIIIPDNVTSISSGLFYHCSALNEIIIPDGVTSIGGDTFNNCSALNEIIIPDGVTSIGGFAFYECSALTEITIPDSVTSIGDFAFQYTPAVNTEYGVEYVDDWVVGYSRSDTEIILRDSTRGIADKVFLVDEGTASVPITVPASVKYIGQYAVGYLTGVTYVEVRSSCQEEIYYYVDKKYVLSGFSGSAAEAYAAENGIAFTAVDVMPVREVMHGDVNTDGTVSISDAVRLARFVGQDQALTPTFSTIQLANADFNEDTNVDANDITGICLMLAGVNGT